MTLVDCRAYLRLPYRDHGRDRAGVDCWGLVRLIVRDVTGIDLGEHGDVDGPVSIARRLRAEEIGGAWTPVAIGVERPLDLVLMTGMIGAGRDVRLAPLHVGLVTAPGEMIDIEATTGVMVRAWRDTDRRPCLPTLRHRVLGVHRHRAIAAWWDARAAA